MTILQMVGRCVKLSAQDFWRKTRMNSKALWLAFRIWRHNRQVRVFKAKVEAYTAKYDYKKRKLVMEQLQRVREQDKQLQTMYMIVKYLSN